MDDRDDLQLFLAEGVNDAVRRFVYFLQIFFRILANRMSLPRRKRSSLGSFDYARHHPSRVELRILRDELPNRSQRFPSLGRPNDSHDNPNSLRIVPCE